MQDISDVHDEGAGKRRHISPASLRSAHAQPADVVFSYLGMPPDPTLGSLQLADGPALGILAYRGAGLLQMDWWYDARRLETSTVEELTAQFRLGLIELASEASVPADAA